MATVSEAIIQHAVEFDLLNQVREDRYYLRIGINYRGKNVQHIKLDSSGKLMGWNPGGSALGTGKNAKVLLAGVTIFARDDDEQLMSDSKIGGGEVDKDRYVRVEFKVRGWLGKTKNLDGAQLEKDFDLLRNDRADLLVICLSETAHLKFRGSGPAHQASRRVGTQRFKQVLVDPCKVSCWPERRIFRFEDQPWASTTDRIEGRADSAMPGAVHYVTLVWRTDEKITHDIEPQPE